jgi:long-chain acyl-CoA synthetase
VTAGERALSLLPPWHIYERTVAYHVLSRAGSLVYSGVAHFKRDLSRTSPHYLGAVPLLLDRLHARVFASLDKLPALKRRVAVLLVSASLAFTKVRSLALCS